MGFVQGDVSPAQADLERAKPLVQSGAVTKEELDLRKELVAVGRARVEESLQGIYQIRVSLGLPPRPEMGNDLAQLPSDLAQNFSTVREAQMKLVQAASQLGLVQSFSESPKEMIAEFFKRDPSGDVNRIYKKLLKDAPAIKQADAKLAQATATTTRPR